MTAYCIATIQYVQKSPKKEQGKFKKELKTAGTEAGLQVYP